MERGMLICQFGEGWGGGWDLSLAKRKGKTTVWRGGAKHVHVHILAHPPPYVHVCGQCSLIMFLILSATPEAPSDVRIPNPILPKDPLPALINRSAWAFPGPVFSVSDSSRLFNSPIQWAVLDLITALKKHPLQLLVDQWVWKELHCPASIFPSLSWFCEWYPHHYPYCSGPQTSEISEFPSSINYRVWRSEEDKFKLFIYIHEGQRERER